MFFERLHKLDQEITLAINSWNSPVWDPIMVFFSKIPVWIPMYLLIIAFLIWRLGWKRGLIVTAAALLTFGFCDQFSNFIKDTVGRLRPLNDEFMISSGLNILERPSQSFSFFSAHAANAFGLATCTYIGLRMDTRWSYKGYATWMYFWATMVSISRIFVGKHYLGDVIAGILIGTLAGLCFALLAKWIINKYL